MIKEDILHKIVENKKVEIQQQSKTIPLSALMQSENMQRQTVSMKQALQNSQTGIIAEFKRKSPSKGWIFEDANIANVVPQYEKAGASACSILTDTLFFGGTAQDLQKARNLVNLPLLRKDFIIDPYQLYEAKAWGADAVLLIAACLTTEQCEQVAEIAHNLSLEVLLEIHTIEELEYLNPHIDMLGVNNRNLGSFYTDIQNSFKLIEVMKQKTTETGYSPLMVSESGISDPTTVITLRESGFRGFLIGENFMKTGKPGESLADFVKQITQ